MNQKHSPHAGGLIHDIIPRVSAPSTMPAQHAGEQTTQIQHIHTPPALSPPSSRGTALLRRVSALHVQVTSGVTAIFRTVERNITHILARINWRRVFITREFILISAIIGISLAASVTALRSGTFTDAPTGTTATAHNNSEPATNVLSAEESRATHSQPAETTSNVQSQASTTPAAPSTPNPAPATVSQPPATTPPVTPQPTPTPEPPAPEPEPQPKKKRRPGLAAPG